MQENSGSIPRNACGLVSPAKHMRDYQESVTDTQTDAGQSDPYVPLCFAATQKCAPSQKEKDASKTYLN